MNNYRISPFVFGSLAGVVSGFIVFFFLAAARKLATVLAVNIAGGMAVATLAFGLYIAVAVGLVTLSRR